MDCPRCEVPGRAVKAATVAAQLAPETVTDGDAWTMCRSAQCKVVYFRADEVVPIGQLPATPFHKSTEPARLVCFCFEHSVSDVEADLATHGRSTIRESIKAACKAGEDDCLHENPQGRCCLGNVGQVISQAPSLEREPEHAGCCAAKSPVEPEVPVPPPEVAPPAQTTLAAGVVAPALALTASALSSACCWLPLAAIGLGVSSGGVGAVFDAWRVPLLFASVGMLAFGFYLVYRKPRCAPDEACEVPNPRLRRFNRRMLWFTSVMVLAFALFPEYVAAFIGGGGTAVEATAQQTSVHYVVEGMTCKGCEAHARDAIAATSGVSSVAVSNRAGTADVVWSGTPDHAAVSEALAPLGYRARPQSE